MKDLAVAYAVRRRNEKSVKGPAPQVKNSLDKEDIEAMVSAMLEKKKPQESPELQIDESSLADDELFGSELSAEPEVIHSNDRVAKIMAEVRARR